MLTTTVDGLWVLQAVTGIEQTCPELGLRPLLPRLDTPERALQHPVAAELIAAGALDPAGNADPMIREWLTVLLRRDLVMTQELIANMLGVRREGVTEAALKLQKAGLIRYARVHITALDRPGLEARSCECYAVVKKEYDRLLPRQLAV